MTAPRCYTPADIDAAIADLSVLAEDELDPHLRASLTLALDAVRAVKAAGGGLLDHAVWCPTRADVFHGWAFRCDRCHGLVLKLTRLEPAGESLCDDCEARR